MNYNLDSSKTILIDLLPLSFVIQFYYRKGFSFREMGPAFACILAQWIFGQSLRLFLPYFRTGSNQTIVFLALLFWAKTIQETWRHIKVSMCACVCGVLFIESYPLTVTDSMEPEWNLWKYRHVMQIMLLTVPQFIRCRPIKDLSIMRTVRSLYGPLYVITACSVAAHASNDEGVLVIVSKCTAAILAVIAGTVFRPDNDELRKLVALPKGWSGMKAARKLHGIVMVSSLAMLIVAGVLLAFRSQSENPTH